MAQSAPALRNPPYAHSTPSDQWGGFGLFDAIENFLCENRKSGILKFLIIHIACDDLVVLAHALNHHFFDKLADTERELFELWICTGCLDDLLVFGSPLFNLFEEQSVLFIELCSEAIVQHVNDFGQWSLLIFCFARTDIGRTANANRFSFVQINYTRRNALEAVILQSDFISELDRRIAFDRQMRNQKTSVTVKHFHLWIDIRHDLAHE